MFFIKMCQHAPYDVDETIQWIKDVGFTSAFVIEEKGKNGSIHLQGLLQYKHNSDYIQREKNGLKYKSSKFKTISLSSNYKGENITNDGGEIFIRYLCKGYEPNKKSPVRVKYMYPLKYILDTNILEKQEKYWEIFNDLKSGNNIYDGVKNMTINKKFKKMLNNSRQNEEVDWYMKIMLYYDKEGKTIPTSYQINKMVKTFMFKEMTQAEKEEYAYEQAIHSLGYGNQIHNH